MPYFVLGSVILVITVIFYFMKLTEIKDGEGTASGAHVFHALKHRYLSWVVAAQFFYVGAQVCVFSFFILYATKASGISEMEAATYARFGVGMAFMIGRFVGTFFMKFIEHVKLLVIYSLICVILSVFAMLMTGMFAIYLVIGIVFFMSIMFPTIFSL
jgi:FHS family L-fucose permease-like MFS transporter